MRGGTGGNFGVLLSVTYKLYPLGDVFGWALAWPLTTGNDIDQATDVLMLLQRDYMRTSQYAPQMNIQVSLCYQNRAPSGKPGVGAAAALPAGPRACTSERRTLAQPRSSRCSRCRAASPHGR